LGRALVHYFTNNLRGSWTQFCSFRST